MARFWLCFQHRAGKNRINVLTITRRLAKIRLAIDNKCKEVVMIYCTSEFVRRACERQARGIYQRDLVNGFRRISGSDITNKWRARYHESRQNLIARIEEVGFIVDEVELDGRLFLVVGTSEADCESVSVDDLNNAWV